MGNEEKQRCKGRRGKTRRERRRKKVRRGNDHRQGEVVKKQGGRSEEGGNGATKAKAKKVSCNTRGRRGGQPSGNTVNGIDARNHSVDQDKGVSSPGMSLRYCVFGYNGLWLIVLDKAIR